VTAVKEDVLDVALFVDKLHPVPDTGVPCANPEPTPVDEPLMNPPRATQVVVSPTLSRICESEAPS